MAGLTRNRGSVTMSISVVVSGRYCRRDRSPSSRMSSWSRDTLLRANTSVAAPTKTLPTNNPFANPANLFLFCIMLGVLEMLGNCSHPVFFTKGLQRQPPTQSTIACNHNGTLASKRSRLYEICLALRIQKILNRSNLDTNVFREAGNRRDSSITIPSLTIASHCRTDYFIRTIFRIICC
jgi:hypothetical protein